MRILVLGINYIPEKTAIGPFTAGLSEHLTKSGHEVQVVTGFPYYPEWRVHEGYRGRFYMREFVNGVDVRRIWHSIPSRASNLPQRLAHDLSFTLTVFFAGLFVRDFDVVYCCCPPPTLALTALLLAKLHRKPYVINLSDLASDAALATGIMKDGLAIRMARAIEKIAYKHADRIVCICAAFVEALKKRGVAEEKLAPIPFWGDTEKIFPVEDASAFRTKYGLTSQNFIAMHTGNMGKKQDLTNVVQAAELSKNNRNLVWLLVGDGEDRAALEQSIAERELTNIRVLPFQPVEELSQMYGAADALLLNQKAAVVDSVIPSKLLTYMAAGRVVVAAVNERSEAAKYVERADCGVIVPSENPAALVDAVQALQANAERRQILGANGRKYIEQHLTKDRILEEYDLLFSRYMGDVPARAEAAKKAVAAS
jgi:colanic acid biosynthesis glycosyl transferase WcaI